MYKNEFPNEGDMINVHIDKAKIRQLMQYI